MLSLRRLVLVLFSCVVFGSPALATWSIVALNTRTGEVCVASATCIASFPLERWLAVLSVGKGGAAAQSAVDSTGANRLTIWNGLQSGATPAEILEQLAQSDPSHQGRQYGIVSFDGDPVSFTGWSAGLARSSVSGVAGEIMFAIQGNVLTDEAVIWDAQSAFLTTKGDLITKVMAGMEAARALGGDGRCSCMPNNPTICGAPPPGFTHSAYTGFVALARPGDTEGTCAIGPGCASGDYFLNLQVIGNASQLDPILQLEQQYHAWRAAKAGIPDHFLTEVNLSAQRLVADGLSSMDVVVRLVDIEGAPLTTGGQTLTLVQTNPGPAVAIPGPISDNGDGTHSFSIQSTSMNGRGRWDLLVQQGTETVQLHPGIEILVDEVRELHAGWVELPATSGASVPFTFNVPAEAGRSYLLLGSASGTQPGVPWNGQTLALNPDRFFEFLLAHPGAPHFAGSMGNLDSAGRATALLDLPTGAWNLLGGQTLHFRAVLLGTPDEFTNGVSFSVRP